MNIPTSHIEHDLLPLQGLLVANDVNEIVLNPDGGVWVERAPLSHMQRVQIGFSERAVRALASHLAAEAGNALGQDAPMVSGRVMLFGRSVRVQIVVPPVVEAGVSLSIRKYETRALTLDEIRFLDGRQASVADERQRALESVRDLAGTGQLVDALRLAVDRRLNILVSGGTSSGKTTLARVLLDAADPRERIVTIEDAAELMPAHENQVPLITDRQPDSPRSPSALLESSLRMRPDRLILGEIRGKEALNFLEAINTGHPGSISTIHADTPALALDRMALLAMQAGLQLTLADVRDYAARTIDVVVQMARRGARRGVLEVFVPGLAPCNDRRPD